MEILFNNIKFFDKDYIKTKYLKEYRRYNAEKLKEYNKKYKQINKEKINQYNKKYKKDNREKILNSNKIYYLKTKAQRILYQTEYNKKNYLKIRNYQRNYQRNKRNKRNSLNI